MKRETFFNIIIAIIIIGIMVVTGYAVVNSQYTQINEYIYNECKNQSWEGNITITGELSGEINCSKWKEENKEVIKYIIDINKNEEAR